MWGKTDNASPALIPLHLQLVDALSSLDWTRAQIWNSSASVFEWRLPGKGPLLAFDVVPTGETIALVLVVREQDWVAPVKLALDREGIHYAQHPTRTERFRIQNAPLHPAVDASQSGDQLSDFIRTLRGKIEASVLREYEEKDPESPVTISYSVKPEKPNNSRVVFLFTSIRTKQHWIDFGGPHGRNLQVNPARIVFIHDLHGPEYSYHLMQDGQSEIYDATVRFIRNYVAREGYDWGAVALAGLSKGGTAALAIAAGLPESVVFAVAPQLDPGRYLAQKHKKILQHMTSEHDPKPAGSVSRLFWRILEEQKDSAPIRRCVVLTSKSDPNCTDGLTRLQAALPGSDQLSVYIESDPSIQDHLQTVRFHSSRLLTLLSTHAYEISASFVR